jgi:hypothetical protein
MNSVDTIIRLTRGASFPHDEQESQILLSAYETLTVEEGKELAAYAINVSDSDTRETMFMNLGLLIPGALDDIYPKILEQKPHDWERMLKYARPEISEQIAAALQRETDQEKRGELISALAWIGDECAQTRLAGIAHEPAQSWSDRELQVQDIIPIAGWELTEDGKRRDLFYAESYELESVASSNPGQPVEHCPWCAKPLVGLFDFPLSDTRLHFLELKRDRIRISTCSNCVQFSPIFMDINSAGATTWSPLNIKPGQGQPYEYLFEVDEFLFSNRWVIGRPIRSPYELAAWLPRNSNCLGGFPGWVQWPEFPVCPECHCRMKFLAQFDFAGVYYAFICAGCDKTAVVSQFD